MTDNERWQWMRAELAGLRQDGKYRLLTDTLPASPGWVLRDGMPMLNLASNDYLGLAERSAGSDCLPDGSAWPADLPQGASASRLVVGNHPEFTRFERQFAAFKGTERCLVFGSGYLANIGIISAIMRHGDLVFSDRLNHASIIDGIVLSRAECFRYRHNDMNHLESLLQKAPAAKRKLIVTDALFSMDGDLAPLEQLVELKKRYGAMLMVDEAHSEGVFGANGEGLSHALRVAEGIDIHMGTFSKAYGCYGAYAAGDAILIDYLLNKARSFIFTTGLPPFVIRQIARNWAVSVNEPWRRQTLLQHAAWFREQLKSAGFAIGASASQIVPVIVGENAMTLAFAARLQQEGVAGVAIRPPSVPEGQARIRFSLMGIHRLDDLRTAVATIRAVGREMGIV